MSTDLMMISTSGIAIVCCALVAFIVIRHVILSRGITGSKTKTKTGNKKKTTPCPAKRKDCAYTTRINIDGVWGCPIGFEDTGCGWEHGKEKGKLQCRACGPENNPYMAYQETNPNCPDGFRPCNQPPFNYGDLKKNDKGEYYYPDGWGVDDPNWNETDMLNPYGGTLVLNKGKWGGTDAHPEVFAKACCAWGNSVDDPQRDKANKTIKVATAVASAVIDVAGGIAGLFTGGLTWIGVAALHGATTAASVGLSTGGQLIRAKCGGPTELYKKTKRSYMFKGPYKDGPRMRGTPGIWYTAGDGCPIKWIQYLNVNQKALLN